MGWNKISDECGKLENAIAAMVQAALNRKQINGGSNVQTSSSPSSAVVDPNPGKS